MNDLFFPRKKASPLSMEAIESHILAQRFEGKCSLDAISTLMKRAGMRFSSVSSISQILASIGKKLPNVLENKGDTITLVFADDEVFAKSQPILITVDPMSSAILRIERVDRRTADKWSDHLGDILNHGFFPRLVTSDAGTAIVSAHNATLPETAWQLDTFHGIAHRLGDWDRRLEKSAYTTIEAVNDRENTLASAKNDSVINKRLNRCFEADKKAAQAIDLYDDFHYLYQHLIHQLNTFDSSGRLRQPEQAKENMEIILDLMESLGHKTIKKKVVSIKKTLSNLLTYFDDAAIALKNCQELTKNDDALCALTLAWQWHKTVIKSKVTSRKHKAIEQEKLHLELAALFIGNMEKYANLKEGIYAELDQIIQASSMVECINSILRPYLNTSKNHVTQAFLNTFMFYHNHRRYHAGKRKGKTPMEILTAKEQKEDWITLLFKAIKPLPLAA